MKYLQNWFCSISPTFTARMPSKNARLDMTGSQSKHLIRKLEVIYSWWEKAKNVFFCQFWYFKIMKYHYTISLWYLRKAQYLLITPTYLQHKRVFYLLQSNIFVSLLIVSPREEPMEVNVDIQGGHLMWIWTFRGVIWGESGRSGGSYEVNELIQGGHLR